MTCLIHTDRTWIFIHKIYIYIIHRYITCNGGGGAYNAVEPIENWKWGDLNKYRKQITSFTDLASKVMWV